MLPGRSDLLGGCGDYMWIFNSKHCPTCSRHRSIGSPQIPLVESHDDPQEPVRKLSNCATIDSAIRCARSIGRPLRASASSSVAIFSEDQHLEIVIAIDVGRASRQRCGAIDRLGHYANIAARFAQYAQSRMTIAVGDRCVCRSPLDGASSDARGLSAVLRIRRLLTAMESASTESNPLYAATRIASLMRHRSLVVMLTDLDDATITGQLASAMRLLLPKHLPLVAGLASVEVDQLAQAPSKTWLDRPTSLLLLKNTAHACNAMCRLCEVSARRR